MVTKTTTFISALIAGFFFLSIEAGADHHKEEKKEGKETEKTELEVDGMTCGGCAADIDEALKETEGVKRNKTSYEEATSRIQYDPSEVSEEELSEEIEELGFSVERIEEVEKDAAE